MGVVQIGRRLVARRLSWLGIWAALLLGGYRAWEYEVVTVAGVIGIAKATALKVAGNDPADVPNEADGTWHPHASRSGRWAASVGPVFTAGEARVGPGLPPLNLDRDTKCLARAIFHEAAQDPVAARVAIGHVAMTRLAEVAAVPGAKASMCAVVYHGINALHGCLFVATCRGKGAAEPTGDAWRQSQQIAVELMAGKLDIPAVTSQAQLAEATHFHILGERPAWTAGTTKVAQVGRFVFLSRRPVEPTDRPSHGGEALAQVAKPVKADGGDETDRKAATEPRKPPIRGEPRSPEEPAPVRSTDAWMPAGGQ